MLPVQEKVPTPVEEVDTEPLPHDYSDDEGTEEDQEINEGIYNQIMGSIEKVWTDFD